MSLAPATVSVPPPRPPRRRRSRRRVGDFPAMVHHALLAQSIGDIEALVKIWPVRSEARPEGLRWCLQNARIAWKWFHGNEWGVSISFAEACQVAGVSPDRIRERVLASVPDDLRTLLDSPPHGAFPARRSH